MKQSAIGYSERIYRWSNEIIASEQKKSDLKSDILPSRISWEDKIGQSPGAVIPKRSDSFFQLVFLLVFSFPVYKK